MNTVNVLASARRIRESSVREAQAVGLAAFQRSATDQDAADDLGCSRSTIKNVRGREHTLGLDRALEWARVSGGVSLQPALALAGLRAVPIAAVCVGDAEFNTRLAQVALKVAQALQSDNEIDGRELAGMLPDLRQLSDGIDALMRRAAIKAA